MSEYVRTFPQKHEGWIRAEIDRLIQSMPDQPAWATDPLKTGEVLILMRILPPALSLTPSDDPSRGSTHERD